MSQAFTYLGTIKAIGQTESRTASNGKTYISRSIRLIEDELAEYPNYSEFVFNGDKCQLLDLYKVGQEVEIKYNIKGIEYTKDGELKFFQTLQGWSINKVGNQTPTPAPAPAPVEKQRTPTPPATRPNVAQQVASDEDDLPF